MEQETIKCPYCGEEILAIAKKCKHCGEWLNNDEEHNEVKKMVPCPICGEMIEEGISKCPHCKESITIEEQDSVNKNVKVMTPEKQTRSFFDYYFVEPFIKHYFKFKGRINRKHFWISMLLWGIFTWIFILLLGFLERPTWDVMMFVWIGWIILSIIPIYAIVLRRMRDGDSELGFWGWWFYILPLPYLIIISLQKSYLWLSIIPFVILLWWLVKPSDNIMRDDGLAPDIESKVTFQKSDIITLCIILVISVGFIFFGQLDNWNGNKLEDNTISLDTKQGYFDVTNPESQTNIKDDGELGKETPYGILSVDDAITLNSFYHLDKIKQILLYHGYQYETSFETDDYTYDYWTKDCKLGRSTYGYELSSGSEKSSYAELGGAGVHVYAYDESVFKAWYSQIVALGYKIDSESQKGNHGQDWIAEKEGEPEISIWNDYGDTYILYVVGNE